MEQRKQQQHKKNNPNPKKDRTKTLKDSKSLGYESIYVRTEKEKKTFFPIDEEKECEM